MKKIGILLVKGLLIPVWLILTIVQLIGTAVVNAGGACFHILSGLFFLTAAGCIVFQLYSIQELRLVLFSGAIFWIVPYMAVWLLKWFILAKIIVKELIF